MDERLAAAYRRCRRLHRQHGRSYYLATRLLPAEKRQHVHALYGFTRYADEIVDRPGDLPQDRAVRLRRWSDRFHAGLAGEPVDDPLLPAVLHTIQTYQLDPADFSTFLASMAMDLTVTSYQDYPELCAYMEGSAAVIGTMLLPILGTADPQRAREPARQLGLAFQLTNFIRDVGEDLRRGRVYLPGTDLEQFGVTRTDLTAALRRGRADAPIQALIRHQVVRARQHYDAAAVGIPLLEAGSQACVRAAFHLYAEILVAVERMDHDVFRRRAVVPRRQRLRMALRSLLTPPGTPVMGGWIDPVAPSRA